MVALTALAQAPPLSISTEKLPPAVLNHAYGFKIGTEGGVAPVTMKVSGGALPPGLTLDASGWLTGAPAEPGSYTFSVEAGDAAKPAHAASQEFTLRVVRPLAIEWKAAPTVANGGIRGSVEVTNSSEMAADVTVIIVAVNEHGKAFVLGYERKAMQADAAPETVQFGSTLPAGIYRVRADAIAEVAERGEIWRAALEAPEAVTITTLP